MDDDSQARRCCLLRCELAKEGANIFFAFGSGEEEKFVFTDDGFIAGGGDGLRITQDSGENSSFGPLNIADAVPDDGVICRYGVLN